MLDVKKLKYAFPKNVSKSGHTRVKLSRGKLNNRFDFYCHLLKSKSQSIKLGPERGKDIFFCIFMILIY